MGDRGLRRPTVKCKSHQLSRLVLIPPGLYSNMNDFAFAETTFSREKCSEKFRTVRKSLLDASESCENLLLNINIILHF